MVSCFCNSGGKLSNTFMGHPNNAKKMMKLIHYTSDEFKLEPLKYDQSDLHWQAKPNGLWFSVEGDYDWKWWCEGEEFRLYNLKVCYELELKKDAKILYLETPEEILDLAKQYPFLNKVWDGDRTYEIDWNKVKEKYQGIIIAPYQWSCRLNPDCNWYYGWDCASGCIWDISCIEEFKLMERK